MYTGRNDYTIRLFAYQADRGGFSSGTVTPEHRKVDGLDTIIVHERPSAPSMFDLGDATPFNSKEIRAYLDHCGLDDIGTD